MKIVRAIHVTEEEFYDFLEQDLIATIKNSTQLVIDVQDIKKGLSYCKEQDNVHARIDVKILDYQRGILYKVQKKSMSDRILVTYETEVIDDKLQVTFHQSIESFDTRKQVKFMKMFSEAIYLGRMSDTIYDIEKKIHKQRVSLGLKRL